MSLINKFGDVNSEILKLNKKIQSIDSFNEKLENNLKEEIAFRQNIEKKTFHMNETFNNKFITMRKGFDDLVQVMTEQIESLKTKFSEDLHINSNSFLDRFEESIKRIENHEKKSNDSLYDLNNFKNEIGVKIEKLEESLRKDVKDIKKDINSNNMKIEILEKKINENVLNIQHEITGLLKDVTYIKNEIEMVKNFKENTILNFKDISEEFIKSEESFNKLTNRLNISIQEFESKIRLFEQTFNLQNDNFANIKKDIYAQIYDSNLNINNKFQLMNDNLFEKLEGYDKRIETFQNSILDENERFTSYLTSQIEQHQKNLKKLNDFTNDDLELLKNKVNNLFLNTG